MRYDLNLNTVTLWAQWKQTIPTTMQGFGDYCKNMVQDNGNNGSNISITLRDTRDNNTYTVAKLKDGNCWMTQNLRFKNSYNKYENPIQLYGAYYDNLVDLSSDTCADGWKIPSKATYENIITIYGASNMIRSPVNFTLAGYYYNGIIDSNSMGYYMTGTKYGNYSRYNILYINDSSAYVDSNENLGSFYREIGYSLRCVSN